MSIFGVGGNLKVYISFDNPAEGDNNQSNSNGPPKAVFLDHTPSWKFRKNPFHNNSLIKQIVNASQNDKVGAAPSQPSPQQQPQPMMMMRGQHNQAPMLFAIDSNQDVSGKVTLALPNAKKFEHLGIKIEFVGRIYSRYIKEREQRDHYDLFSLKKELAPPGCIYTHTLQFPFCFPSTNANVEYETYHGRDCSLVYLVRVYVERKGLGFLPPIIAEKEILIQKIGIPPVTNNPIKMEVGIEDCLHIEFEYERKFYHLKDTIAGSIHFLLVKIRIKHCELALVRRESQGDFSPRALGSASGMGNNSSGKSEGNENRTEFSETQTLTKHEIMDGAPSKFVVW